ncbi:hypothetical protein V5H05_09505 [Vibrio cholerae]|uniref:hypothetical protein n=1 Tax=Vibrio cholerae TaxID=666 RepID=UPI003966C308
MTKNICFFKRALAGSSGQSFVNIINADWPAVEFGGEVSFPAYYLNAVGSYVRFATKERKIRVLIAGTQTTSQSVEISLIGGSGNVYRTETINPRTSQSGGTGKFKLFIAEFENLSDLTTVQVKQTDATAPAYVLGVNAEFNDLTSYDIDTKVHQNYADVNDTFRANASGAMNYAIQEASTSLFGGESHGGETVLSASFMLDTINYFPESGDVKVCATLTINQETLIDWGDGKTVGVKQSQRYRNGAVTEFTASFKPSIGFKAKQFYVGMLTNNNHFTDVTFPIVRNFPKGVVNQVELPKSNYFEVVSESGIYHNGISFEDFTANSVSQNFYYANAFGPQHNKFYTGYVSRIDNVYGQDVKEFSTRTCRFYY